MAYGSWTDVTQTIWTSNQWNGQTVYSLELKYRYRQDLDAGKSEVQTNYIRLYQHIQGWGMTDQRFNAEIGIASQSGSVSGYATIPPASSAMTYAEVALSQSKVIDCNASGDTEFYIYWKGYVNYLDSYAPFINTFQSLKVMLPHMDRNASILSVTNSVTLTGNCIVEWKPFNTSHTYKLSFTIDSHTVTVNISAATVAEVSAGSKKYTYSMPIATWAPYILNSKNGICTVSLSTYSGSTQIGSANSKTFTVKIPSTAKPVIEEAHIGGTKTFNTHSVFITGYKISFRLDDYSTAYGADLKTLNVTSIKDGVIEITKSIDISANPGAAYDIGIFTTSGDRTFSFTVTDTRGYTSDPYEITRNFKYYSKPSIMPRHTIRDESTLSIEATGFVATVIDGNVVCNTLKVSIMMRNNTTHPDGDFVKVYERTITFQTVDESYEYNDQHDHDVSSYIGITANLETNTVEYYVVVQDQLNTVESIHLLTGKKAMTLYHGGDGLEVFGDFRAKSLYEDGESLESKYLQKLGIKMEAQSYTSQNCPSATNFNVGAITFPKGLSITTIELRFASNANGYRQMLLSETPGGATAIAQLAVANGNAVNGTYSRISITYIANLNAETTYYITGYQNSGSTLAVLGWMRQLYFE